MKSPNDITAYLTPPTNRLYSQTERATDSASDRLNGNGSLGLEPIQQLFVRRSTRPSPFIYAILPNGDLIWYRHLGREDGTFRWEGGKKVGTGWAGFEHVFSGGDGIIYAIDPISAKAVNDVPGIPSRLSGGNLWWYRHVGREDGSFRWEGPKMVGTGWAGLEHVFSGGDGIIYAVDPVTDLSKHVPGRTNIASGGNLKWYRHVGHEDGSFRWEGPKTVGTGWAGFPHLFSGGDGIIYVVTPLADHSHAVPGRENIASGGDLRWYRHLGREDGSFKWEGPNKVGTGWASLQHIFSGGDGVIYGIDPVTDLSNFLPGRSNLVSGGDLRWYRHLGRDDGSFRWDGPRQVGRGWGNLQGVFSGGRDVLADVNQVRCCGVPDPSGSGIHITTYGSVGGRWSHGNLRYIVDIEDSGLTQAYVDGVMAQAFMQWQNVAPFFSFIAVSGKADIFIQFGGSLLEPELGEPGVLGVGHYPPDGRLSFRENIWDMSPASRQSLFAVALHEIGHVLGLGHSDSRASIMYPYKMPNDLDAETIQAINDLYGWQPQRPFDDRASTNAPSLAVAGTTSLVGNTSRVYMAWRGSYDDDSVYWSFLEGDQWSSQSSIPGIGSLNGPALATGFSNGETTGLFMAWDGVPGDDGIYFAQNADPAFQDWTDQSPVPGVGTSARPALAMFNGQMHMAWKGVDGDSTIYWSRFDGSNWTPQRPIFGRGTSRGPALAALGNRLYMFWKGIDGDSDAYFAWMDDQPNAIWQVQQKIAYNTVEAEGIGSETIGTSAQLVATTRGDTIVLAWKGARDDSGIYFSRLRNDEWSGQINVPNIGSAAGPALASFNGRLELAWRGIHDTNLYFSWLG
ncbi:MAG TPA: tachylectin-related carbohydrate-binding protein [Chthoniobacterales bacterium]|jgi:hypothetical protein